MKAIREIFSENLKNFRGERTQEDIAEKAEMPLRTYQTCEQGRIPHPETMSKMAAAFGKTEAELFVDHQSFVSRTSIAIQDELLELIDGFLKLDKIGRGMVMSTVRYALKHAVPASLNRSKAR